jgi:ferritin heavy chain
MKRDKKDNRNDTTRTLKYEEELEALLSAQINLEYSAFYFYTMAYSYFSGQTVALPGLAKFYRRMYKEEITHGVGVIDYMNKRGLKVKFDDIEVLLQDLPSFSEVLEKSLEFEKRVEKHLHYIYKRASEESDFATSQFLDAYIEEQVDSIKEFNDMLVNAKRCEGDLGVFLYDRQLSGRKK